MTRICVFGAGGVGGYLAGMLARAGRDVSIVARGAHLDRIKSCGLTIRNVDGEFSVAIPASDSIGDFRPFDVIIITAKAPGLPAIAHDIAPHIGMDSAVLFATNGVQWFYGDEFAPSGMTLPTRRLDPDGEIHRLIGSERSFGVIVRSSNFIPEPGVVFNSGGGVYALGSALDRNSARSNELVAALDVEGAKFHAPPDIRRAMWQKLVRNAAVALLCGLTHATPGLAFSDPATAPIALNIMQEVMQVAAAHGFADLIDVEAEMEVVSKMLAMKPSIVQDLELGRLVELDAQILILLDFAEQAQVDIPALATLAPVLEQKARLAGCYV